MSTGSVTTLRAGRVASFGFAALIASATILGTLAPAANAAANTHATPSAAGLATTAITRSIIVEGLPVAYRSFGHGPSLLLTGCLGLSMDDWDPALLDELALHHTVVLFDADGIGRTPATAAPRLTVTQLADQTVGLIDALHLSKPSLFGFSLGGFVAQRIAVTDPQLLSAVILAGTSPGGAHETLPNLRLNAPLLSPLAPADQLFPLYFSGDAAGMTAWQQRVDQRQTRVEVSLAGLNRERAALGGWLKNPRANVATRLSTISIPTLVLGATLDQQEPAANSQYLASVIPHARLILYPGLGHAFPFEAPHRVAGDITAFLDMSVLLH